MYLPIYLSIYLCIYVSIYLSVRLSLSLVPHKSQPRFGSLLTRQYEFRQNEFLFFSLSFVIVSRYIQRVLLPLLFARCANIAFDTFLLFLFFYFSLLFRTQHTKIRFYEAK